MSTLRTLATRALAVVAVGMLTLVTAGPVRAQTPDSTHVVQAGETLYGISRRYGMSIADLQRLNGLEGSAIRVGQRLRIVAAAPPPAAPAQEPPAEEPPAEVVTPPPAEEPPAEIVTPPPAEEPPVEVVTPPPAEEPPAEEPPAEEPPAEEPPAEDPPAVEPPAEAVPPPAQSVPRGQPVDASMSVYDVAFRLGIPADSLLAINPGLPDVFEAGDTLVVPRGFAAVTVRVQSGDTLFRIASRHGTTVEAIREMNALQSDRILIGQELEVPSGDVRGGRIGLPAAVDEGGWTEYPERFAGRLMASGRPYDPEDFVLAHATIELGTVVLVTHPASGRSVFAEVADRMPERPGMVAEVSHAVARALGRAEGAVILRVIDRPLGGGGP
jgi:LysM repeat protein